MQLATCEEALTVVIVDDNADHRILLREMVGRNRIGSRTVRVQVYEDADVALAELPPSECVVVLIDYRLRGSSGLDWLPDFTRAGVGPVIMMTSSGDEQVASEAFKLGAMDYIDKDSAISEQGMLEKAITGAMRRYKLERTNRQLSRELKLANRELRAKNDRLAELTLNAQQFVSDVAHEFRTPLAVIKEFAAIISDGIGGEVTGSQQEYLNFISGATVDLANLVDDFLDTGKLRSGTLRVSRRGVQPVAILDESWAILESRAKTKGVQLVRELENDLPEVFVDPEKAARTLINLVTNAIKFSNEQGRVTVRVSKDGAAVRFSVLDQGPGLSETDVADLFDRFHQGAHAKRISEKGFGLGLSIVRDLVGVNLGEVRIESTPGSGSEFSFTAPRNDLHTVIAACVHLASQREPDASMACLVARFAEGDGSIEKQMRCLEDVTYCTDVLLPLGDSGEVLLIGKTAESHSWISRLERELGGEEARSQAPTPGAVRFRRIGAWPVKEAEAELTAAVAALQGDAQRAPLGSHC